MELTLEQAADYIEMSAEDLNLSRMRGLAPGKFGYSKGDGKVYFNKADLLPPPTDRHQIDEVAPDEGEPYFCISCPRTFMTGAGLASHERAAHWEEWFEEEE